MTNILNRLDSHNVFCEDCDSKQLRKDAAEEIRRLQQALSDAILKRDSALLGNSQLSAMRERNDG